MKLFNTSMILLIALLLITGCTGVTGNPARPPPPSAAGGGCGVAAPVEQSATSAGVMASTASRTVAF